MTVHFSLPGGGSETLTIFTYNGVTGNLEYQDENTDTNIIDIISDTGGNQISFDLTGLYVPQPTDSGAFSLVSPPGLLRHLTSGGTVQDVTLQSMISVTGGNNLTVDANGLFFVPTGSSTVTTALSVVGDGSGGSPVQLVNDVGAPGNLYYYGTNITGTKGYHLLPTQTVTSLVFNSGTGNLDYTNENLTVNPVDIISNTGGNALTFDATGLYVPSVSDSGALTIIGGGPGSATLRHTTSGGSDNDELFSNFISVDVGNNLSIAPGDGKFFVSTGASTVNTALSVTGDGSGGSPVQLVNDAATPGNSFYYGTGPGGAKGFFPLPVSGGETVTSLVYNGTTGNLDYTDEGLNLNSIDIISSNVSNILTFDATGLLVINPADVLTTLNYNGGTGNLDYVDELGSTNSIDIISSSPNNILSFNATGLNVAVLVVDSITGFATSGSPLKLINDEASPGSNEYYGTNVGGTKGWFPLPPDKLTSLNYNGITGNLEFTDENTTVNAVDIISSTVGNQLTFDTSGLFVSAPVDNGGFGLVFNFLTHLQSDGTSLSVPVGDFISIQAGNSLTTGTDNKLYVPSAASGAFSITDTVITETVNSGDTVTFVAGGDLTVAVSATDTVTYSFSEAITSLAYVGGTGSLSYIDENTIVNSIALVSGLSGDNIMGFDTAGLTAFVNTTNSITGVATPGSPLELVNDVAAPGNTYYYGTNAGGTKGWYILPSGVADLGAYTLETGGILRHKSSSGINNDIAVSSLLTGVLPSNNIIVGPDGLLWAPQQTNTTLAFNGATGNLDYNSESGLQNIDVISSTIGNQLTFDATGLFVPAPSGGFGMSFQFLTHTASDGNSSAIAVASFISTQVDNILTTGADNKLYAAETVTNITNTSGVNPSIEYTNEDASTNFVQFLAGSGVTITGGANTVTISATGGGSETTTTISNLVAGHLIGTYSNEIGTLYEIDETVTSLTNTSGGNPKISYFDENGAEDFVQFIAGAGITVVGGANTITITNTGGGGGGGTISVVNNTIAGNKIADHNDGNALIVPINETITSLTATGGAAATIQFSAEGGGTDTISLVSSSSISPSNPAVDLLTWNVNLSVDAGNILESRANGLYVPTGGGSTDYISNVQLVGNLLTFTGVGSAFNGAVDLSTYVETVTTLTSGSTSTNMAFVLTYDKEGIGVDDRINVITADTDNVLTIGPDGALKVPSLCTQMGPTTTTLAAGTVTHVWGTDGTNCGWVPVETC